MKASFRMLAAAAALVALTVPHSVLAALVHRHPKALRRLQPRSRPTREHGSTRATALDDPVTALTVEMNKATGQAKIDAMARLLTALVQHRSMMLEEMKMMQDDLDAQHEAMQRMDAPRLGRAGTAK